MLNIYIVAITGIVFALCTALIVFQAINSILFRKNVAAVHGFFEGIITGYTFPGFIATYALIFVQFASFIAFSTNSELFLTLRLIFYAISVLAFTVFKHLTPPLLALWFGKTAFWDNKGEAGKNLFGNIYSAKVHKNKNVRVINNQQLYRISFYVHGRTAFLFPRKYTCKMTAKQIGVLTNHIDFKSRSEKPDITKKALIYAITLPILVFTIVLTTFIHFVSTGILNEEKYTFSNTALTSEITTVTEISDIFTDGSNLYVYYDRIGALNAYSEDGTYRFSISLPHSIFKSTDICYSDGTILYRFGDELITYSSEGNYVQTEKATESNTAAFQNKSLSINDKSFSHNLSDVFVNDNGQRIFINRPTYLVFFSPTLIWPVTMALIIILFLLKSFTGYNNKEMEF